MRILLTIVLWRVFGTWSGVRDGAFCENSYQLKALGHFCRNLGFGCFTGFLECVPLTISYHLYFFHISKVSSTLHEIFKLKANNPVMKGCV